MPSPNIRYIVRNVEEAVSFYTKHLGFTVAFQPAPGFAIVARGDVRLALNAVGGPGGASQPMPDGRIPEPGGWNRNTIVSGIGGKQILVEDPSGNLIELFEPKA